MPTDQLGTLLTEQGKKSLYDAVSQCTRCGFCEQACPTYVATGREGWSGRGRNQVVRMLLENKFRDPTAAEEALSTCLLCGACTTVCPAHVPTAEIVLEGRRLLRANETPGMVKFLTRLLVEKPHALKTLLKIGYFFKRWKIADWTVKFGILRLVGLKGLEEAARDMSEVPTRFLDEILNEDSELEQSSGARWQYFSACGPSYILPKIGVASVAVLKARLGRGTYFKNQCCGLLPYNYGELEYARQLARLNIERWESLCAASADDAVDEAKAPVVVDCSSCAAHLKNYPQLFIGDSAWGKRAESFSRRVRDIVELFGTEEVPDFPRARSQEDVVTYHDSCRARQGQGIVMEPRRALQSFFPQAYRELPEADVCCGGAGAFAFVHPELSQDVLRRKIAHIASTHARVVAASSTSCLLQLARGLKKYYPECRAVHWSELAAEAAHGQAPRT